jgi:hypothetical protein
LDTNGLDKLWADEKAISELLKADKELAAKCKVHGTPTVFINGLKLTDRSVEGYHNRINQILSLEGKSSAKQVRICNEGNVPAKTSTAVKCSATAKQSFVNTRQDIKGDPNSKDVLEVTSSNPAEPAVLALGEEFNVEILYELNTLDSAAIWVRPYTNGQRMGGYKAHHVVLVDRSKEKTGVVTGWFGFDGPAEVNEIRVLMEDQKTNEVVKEISYKISAKWEGTGQANKGAVEK